MVALELAFALGLFLLNICQKRRRHASSLLASKLVAAEVNKIGKDLITKRAAVSVGLLEGHRAVLLAVVSLGGMRCARVILRALVILLSGRVFAGRGNGCANVLLHFVLTTFLRHLRCVVDSERALLLLNVGFVLSGTSTGGRLLHVVINVSAGMRRGTLITTRVSGHGRSRLSGSDLLRILRNLFSQRVQLREQRTLHPCHNCLLCPSINIDVCYFT